MQCLLFVLFARVGAAWLRAQSVLGQSAMLNRPRVAPISTQCEQLPLLNAGCIAQVLQLCGCERAADSPVPGSNDAQLVAYVQAGRCDQAFGNEAGGRV